MGWLYTHKSKDESAKDFIASQVHVDNEHASRKAIDIAIVDIRTAYIAYEMIDKASGDRRVVALILLLDYRPKEYHNFGYKDIDETMGPYQCRCPERILKQLTPLLPGENWAQEWRDNCWK
jgi:hypothetical protein